ncbi:hypothetical protein C4D60_Mb09t02880 [Musa balbisiana]|uniref:Uncharacterized protein n=1 Tax=Musa balbisiana TaxID=52838 RepID=A0A4S8IG04_MUSBA|nr:hypothetical protein C4D60_Mb09t02880 [Musa balbisiana]
MTFQDFRLGIPSIMMFLSARLDPGPCAQESKDGQKDGSNIHRGADPHGVLNNSSLPAFAQRTRARDRKIRHISPAAYSPAM